MREWRWRLVFPYMVAWCAGCGLLWLFARLAEPLFGVVISINTVSWIAAVLYLPGFFLLLAWDKRRRGDDVVTTSPTPPPAPPSSAIWIKRQAAPVQLVILWATGTPWLALMWAFAGRWHILKDPHTYAVTAGIAALLALVQVLVWRRVAR